jgi:uncharacterized membrane protein
MGEAISLWPLIGIAVIVVGFVLRFNPVLVVIISGIVTGVAAQMPIATILEKLGRGFLTPATCHLFSCCRWRSLGYLNGMA